MAQADFYSDNVAPVAGAVLRAIVAANAGPAAGYGADAVSQRLQRRFGDLFEAEVRVFPVATGTAANALSLSALTPPYGAVYCSSVAHIHDSECGAAEFFTGGAKLVPLPEQDGRVSVETLREAIAGAGVGRPQKVQPAALSLTQGTERGTVYPVPQVRALCDLAHEHGMKVHMDGARFANAAAGMGVSAADLTWRAGVDVLSFGATKNGAMGADAIVVFDPAIAEALTYRCRRAGQVFSKMRFVSAQLEAIVEGGLWLDLAGQANRMAARLGSGLGRLQGVELLHPVEINEVFVRMPPRMVEGLRARGFGVVDRGGGIVRLVTAFDIAEGDVDALLDAARTLE
jgi:threonine aldolase